MVSDCVFFLLSYFCLSSTFGVSVYFVKGFIAPVIFCPLFLWSMCCSIFTPFDKSKPSHQDMSNLFQNILLLSFNLQVCDAERTEAEQSWYIIYVSCLACVHNQHQQVQTILQPEKNLPPASSRRESWFCGPKYSTDLDRLTCPEKDENP